MLFFYVKQEKEKIFVKYAEKLRWKLCDPSQVLLIFEPFFYPFPQFNDERFRNCINDNDNDEISRKAFFVFFFHVSLHLRIARRREAWI